MENRVSVSHIKLKIYLLFGSYYLYSPDFMKNLTLGDFNERIS